MSSIMRKWIKYKRQELNENTSSELIGFFKTCPTEEQIYLLDRANEKTNLIWSAVALAYLCIGIGLGLFIQIGSLK